VTIPRRIRLALQIALIAVLWGIWAVIIDEKCSRHVSDDETAGMAYQQIIPLKGGK
jgi:hypothetical protein